MSAQPEPLRTPWRQRSFLALPFVVFGCMAALLLLRLNAGDPSLLPSVMIGRPAPAFALPPVPGLDVPGLTSGDLRSGHVTLVNVFASWCVECHAEHEMLLGLAQDQELRSEGIRLVGLAYKDVPADTRRYLAVDGNPFTRVGNDEAGRTGIDLGVYGVPETFVVKGDGTIAFKLVGGLTRDNVAAFKAEVAKAAR